MKTSGLSQKERVGKLHDTIQSLNLKFVGKRPIHKTENQSKNKKPETGDSPFVAAMKAAKAKAAEEAAKAAEEAAKATEEAAKAAEEAAKAAEEAAKAAAKVKAVAIKAVAEKVVETATGTGIQLRAQKVKEEEAEAAEAAQIAAEAAAAAQRAAEAAQRAAEAAKEKSEAAQRAAAQRVAEEAAAEEAAAAQRAAEEAAAEEAAAAQRAAEEAAAKAAEEAAKAAEEAAKAAKEKMSRGLNSAMQNNSFIIKDEKFVQVGTNDAPVDGAEVFQKMSDTGLNDDFYYNISTNKKKNNQNAPTIHEMFDKVKILAGYKRNKDVKNDDVRYVVCLLNDTSNTSNTSIVNKNDLLSVSAANEIFIIKKNEFVKLNTIIDVVNLNTVGNPIAFYQQIETPKDTIRYLKGNEESEKTKCKIVGVYQNIKNPTDIKYAVKYADESESGILNEDEFIEAKGGKSRSCSRNSKYKRNHHRQTKRVMKNAGKKTRNKTKMMKKRRTRKPVKRK